MSGTIGNANWPAVAAVVLAAGRSRRMPGANKLLLPLAGRPLVTHAVDAARLSSAEPVIVVVGHQASDIRRALAARPVRIVENPDYPAGLATSVRAGVAAVPCNAAAAVFLLGDAPLVRPAHVNRIIAAFACDPADPICVPVHAGRRGNPVLWPAQYFADLRTLAGDKGARPLLDRYASAVRYVAMRDAAVVTDIDTTDDLRRIVPDGSPEDDGPLS